MSNGVKLYTLFCAIFCTIIITSNLIFQKFISFELFNQKFDITVGVLFYPITFLISDLVTEFFGKKNATFMVKVSVVCSIIILILIKIADACHSNSWSKVDDFTFHVVFGSYSFAVIISIFANYVGQVTDIYIFSYLKQLTDGKYLWLRNIISTLAGLTVDAVSITSLLSIFGLIEFEHFKAIMFGGIIFKLFATIISVPIYYLFYHR
ncbi:MAG: VUT family protein [Rickettsiales bacterium]|nr:MAG: VUT family protein [Rickettsiales bacterium]